ncbi:TELO2-interacting protein 1 homolog isoform X2 [Lineus longissimus]|uniref:TELO2-interacting protein 1 homolog isoform X2 n=1 Tax=Lineus longissimus TaxID=88925 RepID=UPI00315CD7B4
MEPATKEVFEKLKPVCIPLIKEPTPENIARLDATLKDLSVQALQQLQEYVLFPLRLALKSSSSLSDKECIGVLDCMTDILKKTTVTNWELFQDLFNCLCLLLSSPGQDVQLNQGSEEWKIAIVGCLMALISQSSLGVLTSVYQVEFLPALGHAVSSLLTLTQHERYQKLKVSAIECLLVLAQVDGKGDQYLMCRIGDIFPSFLPGIAIALSKVITGDVKQGQAVTVHAIRAWASLVTLVVGDATLTWAQNKQISVKAKNEKQQQLVIERSPDWAQATADKLDILIGRIVTLTSHANWKVRLAMVNWAEQLLNECQRTLKGSIPKLLEVIVGLTTDDYPNVCKRSEKVLEEYRSHQTRVGVKSLVELLEENLYTLATTLPRLIRTADDEEKLKTVRLLSGYLKILGPNMSDMFNSCSHIRRLGWSLMQVVELSCGDLNIVEERTANMDSSAGTKEFSMQKILKSRKTFKHFSDGNIFTQICTTCHYIGYYGDLSLLVDYFTEQILTSRLYRKEAILILNEIILGCCGDQTCSDVTEDQRCLVDTISSLAELYMSDMLYNVSTGITAWTGTLKPSSTTDLTQMLACTSISPKSNLSPTLLTINSNIQQICLLVEGIANFAMVLGGSFSPLMMVVLYPLLEKRGDDTLAISRTALYTIQTICDKTGYSCISDMICSNIDYLMHTISLKMRHFSSSMRAPLVLGVMFDLSGQQLLSYLKDTIHEVFLCLDDHHGEDAFLLMRVLAKLISAINRWYGMNLTELTRPSTETSSAMELEQKSCQTLREYFLEYDRHAKIARMENLDTETVKWYKKLAFHLIQVALLNAHILHKKQGGNQAFLAFSHEVIGSLIFPNPDDAGAAANVNRVETIVRLTERHFPSWKPDSDTWKNPVARCRVCTKKGVRRATKFICAKCPSQPGLCIMPCFELWHTKHDYAAE